MTDENDSPSRRAWVIEGLRALASGGIDSVKIERISRRLGVSKAPFYWRFKDHAALCDAMLDYWRNELTGDLILQAAGFAGPKARLEALIRLALDEDGGGIKVSAVEGAIRAWAAQDARVGTIVAEVDAQRVRHVSQELRALGAQDEAASDLATAIYLALIGLYSARRYTPALADDRAFTALVRLVLDSADSSNIEKKGS